MVDQSTRLLQLPWSTSNDDETFKKILIALFIVYMLIALPIVIIKLPQLTRAEQEQLPPQLARIMLERQELPQPITPPQTAAANAEKLPTQASPQIKSLPAKKIEQAQVQHIRAVPEPKDKSTESLRSAAVAQARERANNSGLMQFKDDLYEMRETLKTPAVDSAVAGISGGNVAMEADRAVITDGANRGSGGVKTAAYSRDIGDSSLAGRESIKVKSSLAESAAKTGAARDFARSDDDGARRSEEEVRKVMEQHKAAIFTIYNKALREDATLQGKVVIKIVIDPSGRVLEANIISSELKAPALEEKLLQRIKLISFSPAKVMRTTLNYAFDFLPQ